MILRHLLYYGSTGANATYLFHEYQMPACYKFLLEFKLKRDLHTNSVAGLTFGALHLLSVIFNWLSEI